MALWNDNQWVPHFFLDREIPEEFFEPGVPLGEYVIPDAPDANAYRIYCTSVYARAKWWLAGSLYRAIGFPGSGSEFVADRQVIQLDRLTYVTLLKRAEQRFLIFEPAPWFRQMEVRVEKYIGPL